MLLGDLVGERDRQRGAAAETDDVDGRVAGFDVVLESIHRLAHALVTAEAERPASASPIGVRASWPMPLRYRLPRSFDGVVVLQRVVIRVKEIADVAVERVVVLILVAGAVECVERHGRTPPCCAESWDNNADSRRNDSNTNFDGYG